MKILVIAVLILVTLILWRPGFNFRAQKPADYASTEPRMDLKKHLSGPMVAEGVVFGPKGRVSARFAGELEGIWEGDSGSLIEHYTYSDGRKHNRSMRIQLSGNGRYTLTADDLIGEGEGSYSGISAQSLYRLRLPEEVGGHVLNVTDWLYLAGNDTIMNRIQMRKFGITVAEVVISIRPRPAN